MDRPCFWNLPRAATRRSSNSCSTFPKPTDPYLLKTPRYAHPRFLARFSHDSLDQYSTALSWSLTVFISRRAYCACDAVVKRKAVTHVSLETRFFVPGRFSGARTGHPPSAHPVPSDGRSAARAGPSATAPPHRRRRLLSGRRRTPGPHSRPQKRWRQRQECFRVRSRNCRLVLEDMWPYGATLNCIAAKFDYIFSSPTDGPEG